MGSTGVIGSPATPAFASCSPGDEWTTRSPPRSPKSWESADSSRRTISDASRRPVGSGVMALSIASSAGGADAGLRSYPNAHGLSSAFEGLRGAPETAIRRRRFADRDEIVSNCVRLWDTGRCRILKAWRVLRRDIATPRPEPRIPRHRLPGHVFPRLPRPDLRCLEDEDRGLRDAEGLVPALHRNGLRTLLRGVPASSENSVPLASRDRDFSLVSNRGPARHRLFDRSDLQFLLHPGPFENRILGPWGR